MEKEQIKNYLETLHAEYLDIANESINNYNNSGKDEQVMKDFYLKEATKYAITVPFKIMENSYKSMSIIKKMAEIGNPNSITDAAVGALCARTSVLGAFLNVRINCKDCEDQKFVSKIIKQGNEIVTKTNQLEKEVLEITNSKI